MKTKEGQLVRTRKSVEARRNRQILDTLKMVENREGFLTPQAVINEATNVASPLHKIFDWDDTSAAEKYRLAQARMLINRVTIHLSGQTAPAYFNAKVVINREEVRGYFPTSKVISEDELYKQVLGQATKELKYWTEKYKQIKELKGVVDDDKLTEVEISLED